VTRTDDEAQAVAFARDAALRRPETRDLPRLSEPVVEALYNDEGELHWRVTVSKTGPRFLVWKHTDGGWTVHVEEQDG